MKPDESQQIGGRLWARFKNRRGEVREVSRADLDALRVDMIAGRFPAFIPTDYREGWYRLAHDEVYRMFMVYRMQMANHPIRRFVPLLMKAQDASHWIDAARADRRDEATSYAMDRLLSGVRSAVQLHGAMAVAFGGATFEEMRTRVHVTVDQAVDELVETRESAA